MMIREPAVAGRFYPREPDRCEAELRVCLAQAEQWTGAYRGGEGRTVLGGIVPHAGWACSGAVAASVYLTITRQRQPGVVLLFGTAHVRHGSRAAVFSSGAWETPLGLARVDERLAQRVLAQSGLIEADPHAHEEEHSLEVQVPFIQHLAPLVPIVPIMVPPSDQAAAVGASVGRTCQAYGVDAVFIGSTDLTHYGPAYAFTPQGVGPEGLVWAKDVNDRRMIELILALREADVVGEALVNHNACGAGAIAATIAACQTAGATRATLLRHTTSREVLSGIRDEPLHDAVGYAGIVFD